jgi:non-specific serine/threonine protein kinase
MHVRALLAAADGAVGMAAQLLEQALALRGPDQQGIVKSLTMLGHVRLDLGREHAAREAFTEAVRRTRASGERFWLIRGLEGFARWLAPTDPASAVRLAGATDRQRHALGIVPWPSERQYLDGWLGMARRDLGGTAYQHAWEDGQASTLAQSVSLAEALIAVPAADGLSGSPLTPREQEVAILLARGLTNKQIATTLVVSPATVRSHVEHILGKLDLRSRAQIAVWTSQQGLLPSGDAERARGARPVEDSILAS